MSDSSKVRLPSARQLGTEFLRIDKSTVAGVSGVWCIDSKRPGPVLGITIHTHGNEPSGLAALWYLRTQFRLTERLLKGKVLVVLNNPLAARLYLAAANANASPAEKRKTRFCDVNMNRLPEKLDNPNDKRYEVVRSNELLPIWRQFTVGFDIHSTSKESEPIIVACGGLQPELIKGFPISTIITNIENVQVGKPAISFYGQSGQTKTLAIEAGSHESATSFQCSIACVKALLGNLGMVYSRDRHQPREYHEYFIDGSLLFPDESFELVKIFEMFEPITQGQVLAKGKGTRIVADFDGHALMGKPTVRAESINEEVLFLSRPVKTIVV